MAVRRARHLGSVAAGSLLLGLLVAGPAAWAAAPTNDDRADARVLTAPQSVHGTLVGATLEATHDASSCGDTDSSVWYQFSAPDRGAVVIQIDAAGKMDATVDLYKQVRSKLNFVDCEATDSDGKSTLEEGLEPGADYAIRVANQTGSVPDTFRLRLLVPTPPPTPPGRHLPADGAKNGVNRLLNPADAYWTRMPAGHAMRLSLRSDTCLSLDVYGPGTQSFSEEPEKRLRCGGYGLYTPTTSGRHYLVVTAARGRGRQPYVLKVAPAGRDDTTPGVLVANHQKVRGSVNGGIDSRDLYRFNVVRRSALTLTLAGSPAMRLVSDAGKFLDAGNRIDRTVTPGRYFVAVEGAGHYALKLSLRTITHSALFFNGRHFATVGAGRATRLALLVRPRVAGPSLISVERFDPVEGWQFLRSFQPRVTNGRAVVRFLPPSIGRYRASASFLGTRDAAPSGTGYAQLRVQ